MIKPTSTADKHQLKILIDTVKNPSKGMFLGGPDASEAESILRKKFKFTDKEISKLKESANYRNSKLVESGIEKIVRKMLKEKKTNRLDELNLIRSKYFDAFERDCIALAKKYWGPDGCAREDFVGSASRYLPNVLK